jgi:hypothetical protein
MSTANASKGAALALAAEGLPVFPLRLDKRPTSWRLGSVATRNGAGSMNRWRQRLAELQGDFEEQLPPRLFCVQNVQSVQKPSHDHGFEHSEQIEHRTEAGRSPAQPFNSLPFEADGSTKGSALMQPARTGCGRQRARARHFRSDRRLLSVRAPSPWPAHRPRLRRRPARRAARVRH